MSTNNGLRANPNKGVYFVHVYDGGLLRPRMHTLQDPALWTKVATTLVSKTTKTLPGGFVVFQNKKPVFGLTIGDDFGGSAVTSFTDRYVVTTDKKTSIDDVVRSPVVVAQLVLPEPQPVPESLGPLEVLEDAKLKVTDAFKGAVAAALGAPFTLVAVKERSEHTVDYVDLTTRVARGALRCVEFVALVVDGHLTVCDFETSVPVDVSLAQGDSYRAYLGKAWPRFRHKHETRPTIDMRLVEVKPVTIRIESTNASVKRARTDVVSAAANLVNDLREFRKELRVIQEAAPSKLYLKLRAEGRRCYRTASGVVWLTTDEVAGIDAEEVSIKCDHGMFSVDKIDDDIAGGYMDPRILELDGVS